MAPLPWPALSPPPQKETAAKPIFSTVKTSLAAVIQTPDQQKTILATVSRVHHHMATTSLFLRAFFAHLHETNMPFPGVTQQLFLTAARTVRQPFPSSSSSPARPPHPHLLTLTSVSPAVD